MNDKEIDGMGNYKQLQQQYNELNQKYIQACGEKAELEYAYNQLNQRICQREMQDKEIRTLHQNVRKLKHDMKNHFMVLASYLSAKDYEGAKAYSSEILSKLNAMNSYVETGNTLLNHIINEKFEAARQQGIEIKAEIENLAFSGMDSMDFSALLGNMLDNAIEASVRETEGRRTMILLVTKKQGYEAICVKNKIASSVLKDNPELKTIKSLISHSNEISDIKVPDEGIHGIGIPRIKEIVEAYHGMYDIYEEDGYFCVSAFIPQE